MAWILLLGRPPEAKCSGTSTRCIVSGLIPPSGNCLRSSRRACLFGDTRGRRPRLAWVSALDRDSKASYKDPV
eukprot:2487091-Pyramimonas_sp.AAC.1